MVGKLSLVSNSITSSKQAIAPVGSKAQVSGNDILGSINGTNVEADTGKTTIDGSTILPGYTGTAKSARTTQDRQVVIGVDNGRYNKNPGIAGTTNVGTGTERGSQNTIINPIGSGADGTGQYGVGKLARDSNLAGLLQVAQFTAGLGGPPPGFGNTSGQMPPLNFGDTGLGSSNKNNGSSKPPSPENQGTTPGPANPIGNPPGQSEQNAKDRLLLDKIRSIYGEGKGKGDQTLETNFKTLDGETEKKVRPAFDTLKEALGEAKNDGARRKAIMAFRNALENTEGVNPGLILRTILGVEEDKPNKDKT